MAPKTTITVSEAPKTTRAANPRPPNSGSEIAAAV